MARIDDRMREVIEDRIYEIALRSSIDPETLKLQKRLVASTNVPPWWLKNGNKLICEADLTIEIAEHPGKKPPTNSLVIVSDSSMAPRLMLCGDSAFVHIGTKSKFRGAIACGDNSSVYIADRLLVNGNARIDARNGGIVYVGRDGLWARDVRVATDDMHRIFDVQMGERLNKYGSTIRIEDHVWLGEDVSVGPGASIGSNSVIGRRSLVTGDVPANCLAVGAPAKVIREGIDWSADDSPF